MKVNVFFIIIYCLIGWILGGKSYYYYNNLLGFIIIYFIVAYDKLYLKKFSKSKRVNINLLIISLVMFIGLLLITNILGLKIDFLKDQMLHWNNINNIFGILIGIALLNLFGNSYFENKFINYISSLSLLFYIIHENSLFRSYIKPIFYQHVFQNGDELVWVIIEACLLFLFGMMISILYKESLQKIVSKMSDIITNIFHKIWNRIELILLKVN